MKKKFGTQAILSFTALLLAACGISEAEVQATIAALPTQTPIIVVSTELPLSSPTATSRPTQRSVLGTKANPYTLGSAAIFQNGGTRVSLRIAEVLRGEDALQKLLSTSRANRTPGEGQEYILVLVEVKVLSGPDGVPVDFWRYDFEWTVNNQIMDFYTSDAKSVIVPDPELDFSLFPGGAASGWMALLVPESSRSPLLVFARYSGNPGFYFALE